MDHVELLLTIVLHKVSVLQKDQLNAWMDRADCLLRIAHLFLHALVAINSVLVKVHV